MRAPRLALDLTPPSVRALLLTWILVPSPTAGIEQHSLHRWSRLGPLHRRSLRPRLAPPNSNRRRAFVRARRGPRDCDSQVPSAMGRGREGLSKGVDGRMVEGSGGGAEAMGCGDASWLNELRLGLVHVALRSLFSVDTLPFEGENGSTRWGERDKKASTAAFVLSTARHNTHARSRTPARWRNDRTFHCILPVNVRNRAYSDEFRLGDTPSSSGPLLAALASGQSQARTSATFQLPVILSSTLNGHHPPTSPNLCWRPSTCRCAAFFSLSLCLVRDHSSFGFLQLGQ